jgi:hypothetical protein
VQLSIRQTRTIRKSLARYGAWSGRLVAGSAGSPYNGPDRPADVLLGRSAAEAGALRPVAIVATGAALGQPIWVPRYLLIATPPLALLAALGVRQVAARSRR